MTTSNDDGDGENTDDIETRIEKLKEQARALNGGEPHSGFAPDFPPALQEQFWKQVIAFDEGPEVLPFDVLTQSGVTMPASGELDDAALTVKLWQVIEGMAFLGLYLQFTDHLSDRELYECLWQDILREPTALKPANSGAAWHIDLTRRGSRDDEEEHFQYLRYYADEAARRQWAEDWPDDPMPVAEPLPFDRDRRLPTPGW
jgi:hypothetical protein